VEQEEGVSVKQQLNSSKSDDTAKTTVYYAIVSQGKNIASRSSMAFE